MPEVLNAAAYRFVDIDDPASLRERLLASATAAELLGTILIAPEGINLFVAGTPERVRGWLKCLQADPRLAALPVRESFSAAPPFRRLRVRVKREIIRIDRPALRPARGRAPAVDAATLARWLAQGHCDAGRPLALLDTRNAFEVDAGAFEDAIDWRLKKFGDFPGALEVHRAELEGRTVVSYCTGGIRCEKAALLMSAQGVENVLQLDGGILGYFAASAEAPGWRGDCVVFDERGAVDRQLAPRRSPQPATA